MDLGHVLNFELLHVRGVHVTIGGLILAVAIVAAGWIISSLGRRTIKRTMAARAADDNRNLQSILRLGHYAIMATAIILALDIIGINLTTVFAAGAIFAIGLGFAMQNVVQNFVSGVILLIERTIRPQDILEVDGNLVRVEEVGMRATLVRTRFEEEMIVPNSLLVTTTIKNFTLHDPLYRVRTNVGVAYSSDLKVVFKALEAAALSFNARYEEREPVVLLTGFGASSVDFEVSIWTDDPWNARKLLSSLNDAIWWALKEASVTIAFPQRDVHFDRDVVEALRGLTGRPPASAP